MVIVHHLKIPAFGCWAKRVFAAVKSSQSWQPSSGQLRFKATQYSCKSVEPKCGDRFRQIPCATKQQNVKLKQPAPADLPVQERSIRLKRSKICCGNPCPDAWPRFDLLYYRRTNRFEREYQQTWNECPALVKKPKILCCFENITPAKYKKRPPQARPSTACRHTCASTQARCPYVTSKGCRPAKRPPKCRPLRAQEDCTKRLTPYPSFSESGGKIPIPKSRECRCLLKPSICEVWAYHHHLRMIKRVPTL